MHVMCVGWQVGRSVYGTDVTSKKKHFGCSPNCAGPSNCAAGAVTDREHWGEDCRGDFQPVRAGRHVRHGYG